VHAVVGFVPTRVSRSCHWVTHSDQASVGAARSLDRSALACSAGVATNHNSASKESIGNDYEPINPRWCLFFQTGECSKEAPQGGGCCCCGCGVIDVLHSNVGFGQTRHNGTSFLRGSGGLFFILMVGNAAGGKTLAETTRISTNGSISRLLGMFGSFYRRQCCCEQGKSPYMASCPIDRSSLFHHLFHNQHKWRFEAEK
jgi:hypothetical protein